MNNSTPEEFNRTFESTTVILTTNEPITSSQNSSTAYLTTISLTSQITTNYESTTILFPSFSPIFSRNDDTWKIALIIILTSLLFVIISIIIAIILTRKYCINNSGKIYFESIRLKNKFTSKPILSELFVEHYSNLCKDSHLNLSKQFEELRDIGRYQSISDANMQMNVSKNRYSNIHPYNHTRVRLILSEDGDGADYINASWIPGFLSPRQYIAAQGPMVSTQDDFWRMIWEYKCCVIVMLTKCIEKGRDKCHQYWPVDDEPKLYGDIEVKVLNEEVNENWINKKLIISMGDEAREMTHFHYLKWNDMETPSESTSILNLISNVRQLSITDEQEIISPIVVHCSAGVGRTGAYIAIDTCLYEYKKLMSIDVFGVTYKMRLARCNMIQNESQYDFVHKTLAYVINSQTSNENISHVSNGNAVNVEIKPNENNFKQDDKIELVKNEEFQIEIIPTENSNLAKNKLIIVDS